VGDQLTVARVQAAQAILSNSHNGFDHLEGLVPVVEDWHAKVTFIKVINSNDITLFRAHAKCQTTSMPAKFSWK
jgi:L1 cell adhesion molecule like protein